MKPSTWFDALHKCQQAGESYVLVTILSVAGSTPREIGAKMIVTADRQFDTVGGGHLEHQLIGLARQYLAKQEQYHGIESYPLASKLGQCCGGAVKVLYEVMVTHSQTLAIFGAGHVAKALIPILTQLPLQIKWIDDRADLFSDTSLFSNVHTIHTDDPVAVMESLSDNSWAIILTHNHQLDYALVKQALKQNNTAFLGMIGSQTKAKRFRHRLAHRNFTPQQIEKLISPIGELSITGKRPIEVAISISAQIVNLLNTKNTSESRAVSFVDTSVIREYDHDIE